MIANASEGNIFVARTTVTTRSVKICLAIVANAFPDAERVSLRAFVR